MGSGSGRDEHALMEFQLRPSADRVLLHFKRDPNASAPRFSMPFLFRFSHYG